jgi:hypothetical protein
LIACESTTDQLSFFDLRMAVDSLDFRGDSSSMKKALMCQIDSSFTGKNSKCYGNASLTKQGNMLSVVSLDNRISVLDLTTFDYLPPKEIIDPSLQCSFFTKS